MIDILTQKLQWCIENDVWSSDDSENSNLLISPKKDIAVAWTGTGFYQAQREKITFNNCVTGHTYCLRKSGTIDEWTKFQLWYLEGINSKLFRTDVPLSREIVEFNNESWEYCRWMRAGAGVGEISNNESFSNTSALPNFLNDIIDIYYDAMSAVIKVAKEHSPEDPRIPDITFRHIMKDSNGYYFVKNFDLWDQTPEKVVSLCIGLGQLTIRAFGTPIPAGFYEDWTHRSTEKWNTLYE